MKCVSIGLPGGSRIDGPAGNGPAGTQSGFTLLEALAGLTIFAVAMTALFGAYASGVSVARVSEQYWHAQVLAQSVLAEAAAQPQTAVVALRGQDNGYRWQVTSRPAAAPHATALRASGLQLYHIRAVVAWDPNRTVTLETLKLGRVKP